MEGNVPTLEERQKETQGELNQRLESRTKEMGITHTFATYLEQMETYLLELERRVHTLEERLKKVNSDKPSI